MWLEGHEQSPRAQAFKGAQGGCNFDRVMTVIIEDPKAGVVEQLLLTARGPGKIRDRPGDGFGRIAQPVQERDGRSSVGNVFLPNQPNRKVAKLPASVPDFKTPNGRGRRLRRENQAVGRQRMKAER